MPRKAMFERGAIGLALLAVGCSGPPDPAGVESAVVGGTEETVLRGHSTVEIAIASAECSGTLIAPDWVITAAHCIRGWRPETPGTVTVYLPLDGPLPDGGTSPRRTVRVNSCHVNPDGYQPSCVFGDPGPTLDCEEVTSVTGTCYPSRSDVALLHLEEPIVEVPSRSIAPPRFCDTDPDPGRWRFPIVFRGHGAATFREEPRPVIEGVFESGDGFLAAVSSLPDFDLGQSLEPGDSGGGFTTAQDDENGPLVRVVSNQLGSGARIWTNDVQAWLWSVLDPLGACGPGSSGPCVWRERTDASDECGDLHCTGAETALACPEDCQAAHPDSDSDGLPDVRDLCPSVPLASGRLQHADGDEDFIGDECDIPGCDDACATDEDDDRVFGACDNCPLRANTDQADCDGDHRGDACSPDDDGDGRLDVCGLDNCIGVRNPDQANCNLDAEDVIGVTPVGDACDPVPCGDTRIELRSESDLLSSRLVMDRVRVDARATEEVIARTGYRFCPCDLADADDAESRGDCSGGDEGTRCFIARPDLYDASEGSATTLEWRDATVGSYDRRPASGAPIEVVDGFGRPEALERYAAPTEALFQSDLVGRWALRDLDEPRWARLFGELAVGRDRPGVFWTHTPGPTRDRTMVFEPLERSLASHYWSGVAAAPLVPARPAFPCFRPVLPFFGPRPCPVCDSAFPEPYITLPGVPSGGMCAPGPGIDLMLGLDGGLLDGKPYFPDGPPYFSPALAWVGVSEPAEWMGATSIRYVGVDPARIAVPSVLVEHEGALRPRELVQCSGSSCPPPPPPCDNPQGCFPFAASSTSRSPSGAPSSDDVLVLSATRRALWLVGRDGVRQVGLERGDRATLALTTPLGRALAATYSASDSRIYAIDEVEARGRRARLLAIDVETGAVRVVAEWPRTGHTERFAMASGGDGSLWIAASGARGGHIVAWLDARADLQLRGIARGTGPLATTHVRASRMGLSIAVDRGDGETGVIGYRAEDLQRLPIAALRGCF